MRDMTTIGFPARPQPTPAPITTGPEQPARSKRGGASRSTSPSTIAALPGVVAVLAIGPDGKIECGSESSTWYGHLVHISSLSDVGDFTAHVDDHFGLRALTRGEWSLAVVFRDDSPISKSLIRAMRTCLENLNEGRVKP